MKYPSLADIAEMKARGYDRENIERAEADHQRGIAAGEICAEIQTAFRGVTLGDGVGLREGWGLDQYEDAAACAAHRKRDEKDNWEHLLRSDIRMFQSSLSFFDPQGMRFHLPAFLIADLEGEYEFGMEFTLTHLSDYHKEQLSLLNAEQRVAVKNYLLFLKTDPDSDPEDIDRALETYWTEGTA